MYRKIDPRIWNDRKFADLDETAQIVFLFLLTHQHVTCLGAIRANSDGLSREKRMNPRRFRRGLLQLVEKSMIEVNEDVSFIGFPNWLKYNGPEGPNSVIKGWNAALNLLPDCPEKERLISRCASFLSQCSEPFRRIAITPEIAVAFGLPSEMACHMPSDMPSHMASGMPCPIQKQKQKQKQEQKQKQKEERDSRGETPLILSEKNPDEVSSQSSKPKPPEIIACDIVKVIGHYNAAFGDLWRKPLQLTSDRKQKIQARLKRFTADEICRAITNIRQSKFYCGGTEDGTVIATPEFICGNDSKIDKWLNYKKSEANTRAEWPTREQGRGGARRDSNRDRYPDFQPPVIPGKYAGMETVVRTDGSEQDRKAKST